MHIKLNFTFTVPVGFAIQLAAYMTLIFSDGMIEDYFFVDSVEYTRTDVLTT